MVGKDNPADFPFQGISPRKVQSNEFWLHGPPWLLAISPMQPDDEMDMPQEELKGKDDSSSHSLMISTSISMIGTAIESISMTGTVIEGTEATEGNSICTEVCSLFQILRLLH